MRFSTSVVAVLALEFGVLNASPLLEIIRTEIGSENVILPRIPVPPKAASSSTISGTPNVAVGRKYLRMLKLVYKTLPYPSAPKSIVKGTARPNIPEIMEKHPGLHGVYIPNPKFPQDLQKLAKAGKETVESKFCSDAQLKVSKYHLADHVFEAQTIGRFVKGFSEADIKGYFLANHRSEYLRQDDEVQPDFKADSYTGSLYQHLLKELGSVSHLDRLAVLYSSTNNRKGKLWKLSGSTDKGIEAFYELARVNSLLVAEQQAWCATATGIKNFLTKFRADRKPSTRPSSPVARVISSRAENPPDKPIAGPLTNPVTPVQQLTSRPRPNYVPVSPGDLQYTPSPQRKTAADDGDYNESPPHMASGDVDRGKLSRKYATKKDLPFDDLFIQFLKDEVGLVQKNAESHLLALAKTLSGQDKTLVEGYTFTFGEALLKCAAISSHKPSSSRPKPPTSPKPPTTPTPPTTPNTNPIPDNGGLSQNTSPEQPDTPTPVGPPNKGKEEKPGP